MTITTEVRIAWPVPAEQLLDHVTVVAGGDPKTVHRITTGSEDGGPWIANRAAQGLATLASVRWSEQLMVNGDYPNPPSLVVLSIDNPYGFGEENRGRWVQANMILPAVVEWLDDQGVPRDAWWWEDETAGTWHPGTVDVHFLDTDDERTEWEPPFTAETMEARR